MISAHSTSASTYPVKDSFWETTVPSAEPKLETDMAVDLVIIGGGLAGLSTAYYAKKYSPSTSIALLEQSFCGYGASGRNFCNVAQLARSGISALVRNFGDENARFIIDHEARMFEDFQSLLDAEDIECEFTISDILQVAVTEDLVSGLARIHKQHSEYGFPSELFDAQQTRDLINMNVYGGLSTGRNGYAQPFKLSQGLKAAVLKTGVDLFENTPVARITSNNSLLELLTPTGRVKAKRCVVATNAYAPRMGVGRSIISPTYTRVLATVPLDAGQIEQFGWNERHRVIMDAGINYWYMQLRPNGQFLLGDAMHSEPPLDGTTIPIHNDHQAFDKIYQEMISRFPWLAGVNIDCAWGGPLGMTESGLPLTGQIAENLYINAGYNGRGVLMAALSGKSLAPIVANCEAEPDYERYRRLVLDGLIHEVRKTVEIVKGPIS